MNDRPIADYALLSDCHSGALVGRDSSVDWLCFPRFDSPSVFARMLDGGAGHWWIRPVGEFEVERRYLDETMVLETTFRTANGTATLTDAMAAESARDGHGLGRHAPHALLRLLAGGTGEVDFEMEFAPRPEYGLVRPSLVSTGYGVVGRGGPNHLDLSCPLRLSCENGTARSRFTLRGGQRLGFALQYGSNGGPARAWSPREVRQSLKRTVRGWRAWSAHHRYYSGPWQDLVRHSGRVLRALTYQPTGAIVAAASTSLPERIGGPRNWDYRYTWIRDASFTLNALWTSACAHEAGEFFTWMVSTAGHLDHGMPTQVVFGVGGEYDLSERILDHLAGWRGSRPVRAGNGAWRQSQLDVYGELLDAADRFRPGLARLDPLTRDFLVGLADSAVTHWMEPDQGIWETRARPQHFLYSKLMCWVALDRAARLSPHLDARHRLDCWIRTRAEIRAAIERYGWNERVGAYTQAFGSTFLDASALMMPIVGFLPATDPRMRATIRAVERELTDSRGLIYRYRDTDDGLPGSEGAFVLCTFWLSHCLALAGASDRARDLFENAAGYVNDVGLLAEEVDPESGELLGNFPQAFSHAGLINAARAIAETSARKDSTTPVRRPRMPVQPGLPPEERRRREECPANGSGAR